jgi:type II secretory pathway component PulM
MVKVRQRHAEVRPLRAAAAHQAIEGNERKSTVRNSSEFVDAAQL